MSEIAKHLAFGVVAALLSVGCAEGAASTQAGAEMSEDLSQAQQENDRYTTACEVASSMTDMMSDLASHRETMGNILARMDAAREHMSEGSDSMMSMRCSGAKFDQMCAGLSRMHTELARYTLELGATPSLDDGRTACSAYTDAMNDMMSSMHGDLAGMSCMRM